jgi:hypothetical protein
LVGLPLVPVFSELKTENKIKNKKKDEEKGKK